jgi:hypothetical protein
LYYKDSGGTGTNGDNQSASLSTGTEVLYTNIVDRDTDQIVEAFKNGSSVTISSATNLSSVGSVNAAELTIGANNSGGNLYNGKTKEIIIYASNQEANRTAIEANIGEAYNIDLPSGVDPGFDQVDGFVETWYDQSGNGNDVVQATAANQPKIVNAGSYLGALLFDGSDDFLLASFSNPFTSDSFTASVVNFKTTSGRETVFDYRASTPYAVECDTVARLNIETSSTFNDSSITITDNQDNLLVTSTDSSDTLLSVDGTTATKSGRAVSSGSASLNIGRNGFGGGRNYVDGDIKEIIIYSSDQRSNRTALETNINGHYSIF